MGKVPLERPVSYGGFLRHGRLHRPAPSLHADPRARVSAQRDAALSRCGVVSSVMLHFTQRLHVYVLLYGG